MSSNGKTGKNKNKIGTNSGSHFNISTNQRKSMVPTITSLTKNHPHSTKQTLEKNINIIKGTVNNETTRQRKNTSLNNGSLIEQTNKPSDKANRESTFTNNPKRQKQENDTLEHEMEFMDEEDQLSDTDQSLSTSFSSNSQSISSSLKDTAQKLEANFIPVLSRKQKQAERRNNKHELPAIRLRISGQVIKDFENPTNRIKEIKKCFPDKQLAIKFMEFAKFDPKIIIIATDDKYTHDILNNADKWPETAFKRGIQIKTKGSTPPAGNSHGGRVTSFSIRLPTYINIEDPDVKQDLMDA